MKEDRKNNDNRMLKAFVIFLLIFLAGFGLFFLFRGRTTISGAYPDASRDQALECLASIDYPFFVYDESYRKEANIRVLFSETKVKSITLVYSLYYKDSSSIKGSEAHNHGAMNISFGKNDLVSDSFDANYAKFDDRMQMNLYVSGSDITTTALKYFFVITSRIPEGLDEFKNIYENQGFVCENK